jgi:hypothetical protein
MPNIKGSASGRPNIFVRIGATQNLASSPFNATNTKIIYALDANGNFLGYTPGQADFLQGFLTLNTNEGYYSVNTQDLTVSGIVPDEASTTTTTSSTTTTTTSSTTTTTTVNASAYAPATQAATHRWAVRANTVTKDAQNKISAIADSIGSLPLVNNATLKPTYVENVQNSQPSASFRTASVLTNALTTVTNVAVVMVMKFSDDNPFGSVFFDGATNQQIGLQTNGMTAASTTFAILAGGGGATASSVVTNAFTNAHILVAWFDSTPGTFTSSKIYYDGNKLVQDGVALTNFNGKLTVGTRADQAASYALFELLDMVILENPTLSNINYHGQNLGAIYSIPWTTATP